MDSGRLDKRISFYKAEPVQDSETGTLSNVPVLQLTTWAQFILTEGAGTSRAFEASELVFNDEVSFKIRKRTSFTPDKTMYILYRGNKYIIHRVRDKEQNKHPFYFISTTVQT